MIEHIIVVYIIIAIGVWVGLFDLLKRHKKTKGTSIKKVELLKLTLVAIGWLPVFATAIIIVFFEKSFCGKNNKFALHK